MSLQFETLEFPHENKLALLIYFLSIFSPCCLLVAEE